MLDRRAIGVEQRREVQAQSRFPPGIGNFVQRTIAEFPAAPAGDMIKPLKPAKVFQGCLDSFDRCLRARGIRSERVTRRPQHPLRRGHIAGIPAHADDLRAFGDKGFCRG